MTFQTVCGTCGAAFTTDFPEKVNAREEPELKAAILDGSLFITECPKCGKRSIARTPLLYHDPDTRLMIWLPADAEQEVDAVRIFSSTPGLEDYTGRLVAGAGELIEKIKIFDAGLDDIAVELCKYVTMQETGKEVSMKFLRIDDSAAEMTLAYPEDGNMQMLSVGLNVYEDCCAILARNPQLRENARGLVRIDQAWLSEYLA